MVKNIKKKLPKVLVCRLVTSRKNYCVKELIDSSKNLTYKNKDVIHFDNSEDIFLQETLEFFDLNVIKTDHFSKEVDKKGKKITLPIREMMARDMNTARDIVLDKGYDYMLVLESDVIPHEDIIEKLLAYDKDIMAAFYWLDMNRIDVKGRECWYTPVNYYVFKRTSDGKVIPNILFEPEPKNLYYPSRVIEYAHAGFGCTLISKKVLEKVKFRYMPDRIAQLDAFFHVDAIRAGFVPHLDTGLIVRHFHEDWSPDFKQ